MFKTGAANVNGEKDQDACIFKFSEHTLRQRGKVRGAQSPALQPENSTFMFYVYVTFHIKF